MKHRRLLGCLLLAPLRLLPTLAPAYAYTATNGPGPGLLALAAGGLLALGLLVGLVVGGVGLSDLRS